MSQPRFYIAPHQLPAALAVNSSNTDSAASTTLSATTYSPAIDYQLTGALSHRLQHVLRLPPAAEILLFCGDGYVYLAEIVNYHKQTCHISILKRQLAQLPSPPLEIHLWQAIAKPERMDFALQKATELGVSHIHPVITAHCQLKNSTHILQKRQQHWQAVCIGAAEQSGRSELPQLHATQPIQQLWQTPVKPAATDANTTSDATPINPSKQDYRIICSEPTICAACNISPQPLLAYLQQLTHAAMKHARFHLCIGPEGGFSQQELLQAQAADWQCCLLGPRTLRTETATCAALSVLQSYCGDWRC